MADEGIAEHKGAGPPLSRASDPPDSFRPPGTSDYYYAQQQQREQEDGSEPDVEDRTDPNNIEFLDELEEARSPTYPPYPTPLRPVAGPSYCTRCLTVVVCSQCTFARTDGVEITGPIRVRYGGDTAPIRTGP